MPLAIHIPTEDDVDRLFHTDGRAFGATFTPEEIAQRRPVMELDRFRMAVDGRRIASIAGSFAFDLTLPGGATVPACGVTWVSSQVTHRRQGAMTAVLGAVHDDARERGEPVAILGASESSIYGRFGYGVASYLRIAAIARGRTALRAGTPSGGDVWYGESPEEVRTHVVPCYDRYRRAQPGELSRSAAWWDLMLAVRAGEQGGATPAFWLLHRDGYAAYRVHTQWNDGHAAHKIDVVEFVALTPQARGALWRTLFSLDLAGEFTTWAVPLDDPLVQWLVDPRALRTTMYNDWLWVKPLDPAVLLRTRAYGSEDRLVLQVGEQRLSVDAGVDGVEVRTVRTRPDLTTDDAGLGALLMGGVRASTLARGGRLEVANDRALHRADALFGWTQLPYSQTGF